MTILRTAGPLAGTPRKEHGMGFSAPMVVANHERRKFMTRRVVTPFTCNKGNSAGGFTPLWKDIDLDLAIIMDGGEYLRAPYHFADKYEPDATWRIDCRYQVGDLIWQRETWGVGTRPCPHEGWRDGIEYRADEAYLEGRDLLGLYPVDPPDGVDLEDYNTGNWKPSIHMPRFASRSLYEITGMRAELVTGISEADALAEGIPTDDECDPDDGFPCAKCGGEGVHGALGANYGVTEVDCMKCFTPVNRFQQLWDSINAKRNYPWEYQGVWSGIVWVIEYKPLVICGERVGP